MSVMHPTLPKSILLSKRRVRQAIGNRISRSAVSRRTFYQGFSYLASTLTGSEWISYNNKSLLHVPLPHNSPDPRILNPHKYDSCALGWYPLQSLVGKPTLEVASLLRIVSWNIDFMAPGRRNRAAAAMTHLKDLFGDPPPPIVVMLQEVHRDSLLAILAHPWVRKTFAVSDVEGPGAYFTLLMVSNHLEVENWLRFPLPTRMGRDALVVDLPISSPGLENGKSRKLLRLCTTHLESLWESEGYETRPRQLMLISALLKAQRKTRACLVGGIVGGDMNPLSPLDQGCHQTAAIDLRDVWEDVPLLPGPKLQPFKKDLTFGRAKGNTWGYQSRKARARKRMDKFLYGGSIEIEPLDGLPHMTGKIGRVGVGLQTQVRVWECQESYLRSAGNGKLREATRPVHFDPEARLPDLTTRSGLFRPPQSTKDVDAWVSDHFGIAVGLRVRG